MLIDIRWFIRWYTLSYFIRQFLYDACALCKMYWFRWDTNLKIYCKDLKWDQQVSFLDCNTTRHYIFCILLLIVRYGIEPRTFWLTNKFVYFASTVYRHTKFYLGSSSTARTDHRLKQRRINYSYFKNLRQPVKECPHTYLNVLNQQPNLFTISLPREILSTL